MTAWLRASADGVTIDVLVQPRASRTRLAGEHDGRLKIQITAPPVDGEANDALRAFVAELLGVALREVEVASGASGRRKTVRVHGVSRETAAGVLASKVP